MKDFEGVLPEAVSSEQVGNFEYAVEFLLAEQEAAQQDIDDSMRRGDLFGAAMGSFQHAMYSFQLGDRLNAQSYFLVGSFLAQADIALISETEKPETVVFDLPGIVNSDPGQSYYPYSGWVKDEAYYKRLEERQEVVKTVAATEAILAIGPDTDPVELNDSISDATRATANLIFSKDSGIGTVSKQELLNLTKRLTDYLAINVDESSSRKAFEAFEHLMLAGLHYEGKTFAALNKAMRGFDEIQYGPAADSLGEKCREYIEKIKRAKQYKAAYSAGLPLVNFLIAFKPYWEGSNNFGDFKRPRTSRQMQAWAAQRQSFLKAVNDPEWLAQRGFSPQADYR